ncbi:hypothetical protein ACFQV2_07445 [Actinokineospora soli]|uniref:Uncharacterized protein n=1 Tax=Actinokineospora soli TaxID=1048753 RepID=A0ABW2TJQ3_9PSEU
MRVAQRVDYLPEFSDRRSLTRLCDLADDQHGRTWYACAVPTCEFAVLMDESNFDAPAAVKVHFRATHLPIDHRR